MTEEVSSAGDTLGSAFGEAVALLAASPKHRVLFISDLEWVLMPALTLRQFRLFRRDTQPAGIALWAYLNEEAEARLQESGKLRPGDWRSGKKLWLVELICPAGGAEAMLENLKRTAFLGLEFSYHITTEKGERLVRQDKGAPAGGAH